MNDKKSVPPFAIMSVFALFQTICLVICHVTGWFDIPLWLILFPFISLGIIIGLLVIVALLYYFITR